MRNPLGRLADDRQRLAQVEERLDRHIAEVNVTNRAVMTAVVRIQTELDERRHTTEGGTQ
jgi:hypothetical protein